MRCYAVPIKVSFYYTLSNLCLPYLKTSVVCDGLVSSSEEVSIYLCFQVIKIKKATVCVCVEGGCTLLKLCGSEYRVRFLYRLSMAF